MIAWIRAPMTADTAAALLRDTRTVERELKCDKHGCVTLHVIDGRRWVVKRETKSAFVGMLRHLLRCSSAWRQWRGAERLRNIGVRINEPVALVHEGRGKQALVLPYVDAVNLHEWLSAKPRAANVRLRVARAIGSQMGRITKAGWINRDHKPTNLMIDAACEQRGEQPVLIDLAGIRRRRGRLIAPASKTLEMFHVMMRAAKRAGPVSLREQLTLLRAAMAEDPTLGRNAADASRTIATLARSRPLSYDPTPQPPAPRP
ncbi:MAG: hypothetical protein ACYC26_00205 [Phycisphaerales bacterium]